MCVLRILPARAPAGVFKPLFDKVKFWIKFLFKITLDNNSRHWQKAQTKVGGWSGQCKCSLWESPSFPRPRPLLHLHHHHIHPGHFSTSINTSSTPLLRHPPPFCTEAPSVRSHSTTCWRSVPQLFKTFLRCQIYHPLVLHASESWVTMCTNFATAFAPSFWATLRGFQCMQQNSLHPVSLNPETGQC